MYCSLLMHSCVGCTMLLQPACRLAVCHGLVVGTSCCRILSEETPELSAVQLEAHVAGCRALCGIRHPAACVKP